MLARSLLRTAILSEGVLELLDNYELPLTAGSTPSHLPFDMLLKLLTRRRCSLYYSFNIWFFVKFLL